MSENKSYIEERLEKISQRATSDDYYDTRFIFRDLENFARDHPASIEKCINTFEDCLSKEHPVQRYLTSGSGEIAGYLPDTSSVDFSDAVKTLISLNSYDRVQQDSSLRHKVLELTDMLVTEPRELVGREFIDIADTVIGNLTSKEKDGVYTSGKLSNDLEFIEHSMKVIEDIIVSRQCDSATMNCVTNNLLQITKNPEFKKSAFMIKTVADTINYAFKERSLDFKVGYFDIDNINFVADNICKAIMEDHFDLIPSIDKDSYVGTKLTTILNGLNVQDLKRQKAEKNFGMSQNITEAKERVMSHLKERHPNMPEETIKNKAKIRHIKGNIKTSKLIGRDITD